MIIIGLFILKEHCARMHPKSNDTNLDSWFFHSTRNHGEQALASGCVCSEHIFCQLGSVQIGDGGKSLGATEAAPVAGGGILAHCVCKEAQWCRATALKREVPGEFLEGAFWPSLKGLARGCAAHIDLTQFVSGDAQPTTR